MDEFQTNAYENAQIYKEKTNMWHDKHISRRELRWTKKFFSTILFFDCFPENYV